MSERKKKSASIESPECVRGARPMKEDTIALVAILVCCLTLRAGGASSGTELRQGCDVRGYLSQGGKGARGKEVVGSWNEWDGEQEGELVSGGGSIYGVGAQLSSADEREDETITTSRSGSSSSSGGGGMGIEEMGQASTAIPGDNELDEGRALLESDSVGADTHHHGKNTRWLSAEGDLSSVVDLISRSRRILVITGAGISASCGIPTFRGDGQFYDTVASEFGLPDSHSVMDIRFFREDPRPFYRVARRLYPSGHSPSATHGFIRSLERAGLLQRDYTQNIDTLERHAGIERVVYCHGSFAHASCQTCGKRYDGSEIEDDIRVGKVPMCSSCVEDGHDQWGALDHEEDAMYKSKGWDDEVDGGSDEEGGDGCSDGESGDLTARSISESTSPSQRSRPGVIKPDIVFFHEDLPESFYSSIQRDIDAADMLLVMGTSLSVAPVSYIPESLTSIPSVFINAEPVAEGLFDIFVQGTCDSAISNLLAQGLAKKLPRWPSESDVSCGVARFRRNRVVRKKRMSGFHHHATKKKFTHNGLLALDMLRLGGGNLRSALRELGGSAAQKAAVGLSRWLAGQLAGARSHHQNGKCSLMRMKRRVRVELQRGLDNVIGVQKTRPSYRGAGMKDSDEVPVIERKALRRKYSHEGREILFHRSSEITEQGF